MYEIYEGLQIRKGTEDRQMVRDALHTDYPFANCKDHRVLDLGAHVGAFTKKALADGAIHVDAVEPWSPNREMLIKNFGEHPLVNIHGFAVANTPTVELSTRADSATGGVSGFVNRRNTARTETVEALTLEELIAAFQPTFVKIDIEGAEYGVLPCNLDGVEHICGELHTMSMADRQSAFELLAWFERNGFYLSYLRTGPQREQMFERLLWMHFHAYRKGRRQIAIPIDDEEALT